MRYCLISFAAAFSQALAVPLFSGANVPPALATPLPILQMEPGIGSRSIDLRNHIVDPDVPGTAVRIRVRLGNEHKNLDLALFDQHTPQTVANFLAYIEAGRYQNNFFHRSVPGFVIQGGGFRFLNDATFDSIPTFAPVQNEPGISNLRGTIAMAKVGGDPNSATSQWFINLGNNAANLDAQNGGFTVFGRVVGNGMSVADEVASLPIYNATFYHPAWTDLPLKNYAGSLTRHNFVETTATVIPALAFAASSANPNFVTASMTGSVLTVSRSGHQSGETSVTVSATDLDGATSTFQLVVKALGFYDSWKSDWAFPTVAAAEPSADPDGDGWPNLLEFAFDGSPLAAGIPAHRPRVVANGALSFGHRKAPQLRYTAWMSSNLQNWQPVWTSEDGLQHAAIISKTSGAAFDLLTVAPPNSEDASARFWRVSVELLD